MQGIRRVPKIPLKDTEISYPKSRVSAQCNRSTQILQPKEALVNKKQKKRQPRGVRIWRSLRTTYLPRHDYIVKPP